MMLSPFRKYGLAAGLVGVLSATTVTARADSWVFVAKGSPLSYLPGHQAPPTTWTALSFAETSAWVPSAVGFGIGYGDGDDATVLTDMINSYLTVYVRSRFQVGPELALVKNLTLEASFDDGFVAYLNGTEVGRSNVPAGPLQPSTAASSHEVTDGPAVFSISPSLLVPGENVLSIEVHNTSLGSSDLSFVPTLFGDDGTAPVDATIRRGPFLQQVGRRSALVVWQTDKPVPSAVSFGTSTSLGQSASKPDAVTHHVVELTGLEPATKYYFQVMSAKLPSPRGEFFTEVDRATPYRLAAFGDTRSNHAAHRSVIEAMALDAPLAFFHSGDLVGTGTSESDWDHFFESEATMLLRAPLYPAIGNHEGTGPQFVDLFELPEDSPSPERYYAVRYGSSLFISIDQYTNPYGAGSDQLAWLETTLAEAKANPDIRQRFVQLHHSPYSSGSHKSNLTVREHLSPLFEQYGVDIVFSGHDHCYERSTVNGVKYVITGGGGAPLYSVAGDWWTEVSDSILHYCLLDIEGARTTFTAKRIDGSILDSFVLGEDVGECTGAADCNGRQPGTCEPGEDGTWACVQTACIWNCTTAPPPNPDAGAGGSGGTGGSSGSGGSGGSSHDGGTIDASAGSGGASGSSGAPGVPASSTDEEPGSCACRLGPSPTTGAGYLGWVALALLGLRRRANKQTA